MNRSKWILGSVAGALLATAPALAAINPATLNLPAADVWGGFGTGSIASNGASSMCVDCHTDNPLVQRVNAGFGTMLYGWQTDETTHAGTHYVGAATNSGGGQTIAGVVTARDQGQYFRLDAWSATGSGDAFGDGFDGYSKYAAADGTTYGYNAAVGALAASVNTVQVVDTGLATYQPLNLICESCHSITGGAVAGSNKLLGESGSPDATTGKLSTVQTGMCEGCHGDMTSQWTGTDTGNGNMGGNNQPERNNHHVLSFTLSTNADLNANWISDQKAAWSGNVGIGVATEAVNGLLWSRAASATGPDRTMSPRPSYTSGGQYNEIGYKVKLPATDWDGGLAGVGATNFNCTDCHAYGHGGWSETGARILRNGEGVDEAGRAGASGTTRLFDVAPAAMTVYTNDQGFCEGCHEYTK